jgi:hypothetical protein
MRLQTVQLLSDAVGLRLALRRHACIESDPHD